MIFWPPLKYCQQYTKPRASSFWDLLWKCPKLFICFFQYTLFLRKAVDKGVLHCEETCLWSAYWQRFPNVPSHVGCLSPRFSGPPISCSPRLRCCLSGISLAQLKKEELSLCWHRVNASVQWIIVCLLNQVCLLLSVVLESWAQHDFWNLRIALTWLHTPSYNPWEESVIPLGF